MDSLTNIRTVSSFANEELLLKLFGEKLKKPMEMAGKKGLVSGVLVGFSNFIQVISFAVEFLAGAYFTRDYGLTIDNMMMAMFAIIFAATAIGHS